MSISHKIGYASAVKINSCFLRYVGFGLFIIRPFERRRFGRPRFVFRPVGRDPRVTDISPPNIFHSDVSNRTYSKDILCAAGLRFWRDIGHRC